MSPTPVDELLTKVDLRKEGESIVESDSYLRYPIPTDQILVDPKEKSKFQTEHIKDLARYNELSGLMYDLHQRGELDALFRHLSDQLIENYESLVYHGELIYRYPLGVCFSLPFDKWDTVFGELPDSLYSWEDISEAFEVSAVANMDTQRSDGGSYMYEGDALRALDDIEATDDGIIAVSMSPAAELVLLGILSEKQAKVYFLDRVGYKPLEIAQILEVEVGTVYSHRNRAERQMASISVVSDISRILRDSSVSGSAHPERVGLEYETPDGERGEIIAYGKDDDWDLQYVIEWDDGSRETVSNRFFERATPVSKSV